MGGTETITSWMTAQASTVSHFNEDPDGLAPGDPPTPTPGPTLEEERTSVLVVGPPAVRAAVTGLLANLGYEIAAEVESVAEALKELKWRAVKVVVVAERRHRQALAVVAQVTVAAPHVRVALMHELGLALDQEARARIEA